MDYNEALGIMGLGYDHTKEQLKKRHRELVKQNHPDLVGDVGTKNMIRINKAYEIIRKNQGKSKQKISHIEIFTIVKI